MNKRLFISSAAIMLLALPVAALAFNAGPVPNAAPFLSVNDIIDVIFNLIWPIAVAFFIIMFIIAAFYFFTAQGDPAKVAMARQFVIWGVVGVVIALLAFSIPFIIRNTLGNGI